MVRRRVGKGGEKCRTQKVRYRDEKSAVAAMRWIASHFHGEAQVPVRQYLCPFCKGYHLTSQEEET